MLVVHVEDRSISSGDSLTALVVGRATRRDPSRSRSPGARPAGAGGGSRTTTDDPCERGRAAHRRQDEGSSPRDGSRPSPLRLDFDGNGNEGRGGGIDQLREDVSAGARTAPATGVLVLGRTSAVRSCLCRKVDPYLAAHLPK